MLPTLLAVALSAAAAPPAAPESGLSWQAKVHPRVLEQAAAGPAEFMVFLEQQADLSSVAAGGPSKAERGRRVVAALTAAAESAQGPLLAELEARGLAHRSFWIANMILVRGDLSDVQALAGRADVRRLDANPSVRLVPPPAATAPPAPAAIEWGVLKILADQVWALGHTGSGVVIGGQDTGYEWFHAAIVSRYRGWDGSVASHDYNWHDAIHAGGGVCGHDSPVPCDDHFHGTHTMGTMVGDDGGTHRIGVATGARWIGCRNMDQGNGTPATYAECFQWFVAPTPVGGGAGDPSRAPDVINNSWACPPSEGCSFDTLKAVVENTRAAGIVVVASAGNSGSGCGTISDPPALYDAAFSVGATDSADQIASFSSRGPVTVDGSERLKPDVSAPGVGVQSCVPGGGYASFSGTSMAGPHVAGLVALLLGARPDLAGRVDEIEEIVRRAAAPKTSGQTCGGIPGTAVPNPIFGWGRVDALAALTGDADGDGSSNSTDCRPIDPSAWQLPGAASDLMLAPNSLGTGLFWSAPAEPGGLLRYDVLRSAAPDDFSSALCLASDSVAPAAFDGADPSPAFYYLVRAENACGGNLGSTSDGTARQGPGCP
jgi:subtilisin family serine protease